MQSLSLNNLLKISIGVLILLYLAFGLSDIINLPTADLGRHISNGRFIIEAVKKGADLKTTTPLYTNFYSYTEASYPVINHHWLTGVVHYLCYKSFGFVGLSILNILAIISGIVFFFLAARLFAGTNIALAVLVLSLPLLIWRSEVRPESFSYMFMGLEFYILSLFKLRKLDFKWTIGLLAVSQLLWINTHIFFSIGLLFIGLIYLDSIIQSRAMIVENRSKQYCYIFIAVILASLINPFGLIGLLEPLKIFHNYAYDLLENQSVWFMHKRFPFNILYYYFDLVMLINILVWFLRYRRSILSFKEFFKVEFTPFCMSFILMVLALKTNRSIPVYILYSIPILAMNLQSLKLNLSRINKLFFYIVLIVYCLFLHGLSWIKPNPNRGLGLDPRVNASAEFFRNVNIHGPIFNNYDIGGYLIFHLYPYRRVFVDNRPEAYSTSFFNEIYKPMQESEDNWHDIDSKVNFNVIYFMRHDMTEHAQPFLIRRISDPDWVPVFVDTWNIILVKRNKQNKDIIKKYALPQEMFKAIKNK